VLGEDSAYAAVAVECAANQGGFWTFHDRFMADDQTLFTEAGLRRQVDFEGLEFDELWRCLTEGETAPLVVASYEEGHSRGVRRTPTVFVNDVEVEPRFEAIRAAVLQAAGTAGASE